jgi:hypothetical protein
MADELDVELWGVGPSTINRLSGGFGALLGTAIRWGPTMYSVLRYSHAERDPISNGGSRALGWLRSRYGVPRSRVPGDSRAGVG